jgi:alpha-beta hydrolase superfamily lysophospholipase
MVMAWLKLHSLLPAAVVLLLLFLAVNLLAYRYVYAYCHFRARLGTACADSTARWKRLRRLLWPPALERPGLEDCPERYGLSCTIHTLAGGRGRLQGWFIPHPGPGYLALVFHGYRTSKARMLPEARGLHQLGCACFLIDFPGSGQSEGNTVSIGYHEAIDVVRTMDYARHQWPGLPLVLYGQSMGSAAILRALAVLGARADAAILECPFSRLLSAVAGRFRNVGAPSFPFAPLFVFWGGVHLGYNGFAHNPVRYARKASLPVCLLYGDRDRRVSPEEVQAIWSSLPGEKELHIFKGVGHESYASRASQEWQAVVGRFLKRLAALKPQAPAQGC